MISQPASAMVDPGANKPGALPNRPGRAVAPRAQQQQQQHVQHHQQQQHVQKRRPSPTGMHGGMNARGASRDQVPVQSQDQYRYPTERSVPGYQQAPAAHQTRPSSHVVHRELPPGFPTERPSGSLRQHSGNLSKQTAPPQAPAASRSQPMSAPADQLQMHAPQRDLHRPSRPAPAMFDLRPQPQLSALRKSAM
ncbi:hypothetical protein DIPPA_02965 [Diplonema papillatum]|nr:hypothetical protein DIPPA_02965 [Diplonema papillatum]